MSIALVDRLAEAGRALAAALDRNDIAAIEAAAAGFQAATAAVGGAGGWRDTPELKARIRDALADVEAARLRCAYFGDAARRRLEKLATIGANVAAPIAYGRQGRI
ncbi:hypothetical protein G432_05970 [Sphingomonas sp. MM-1]|uniref:hypothetical protein n=1 Tax=Sphingomonas sp. MM-1 TaxID=745310 RepID=UPI0002C13098|nr:hypothetical protein [Sphingomonas sp. MM-1]AGH48921.1 hypothetical protein G432_05970 [Sphingomonas sp. MM-1]